MDDVIVLDWSVLPVRAKQVRVVAEESSLDSEQPILLLDPHEHTQILASLEGRIGGLAATSRARIDGRPTRERRAPR